MADFQGPLGQQLKNIEFNKIDTRPEFWSDELEEEFATIAKNAYPKEAVAVLAGKKLLEIENVSDDPENNFISSIPVNLLNDVLGIIHSHPNGNLVFSRQDCETQLAMQIPSGIVSITEDSISNSLWLGDHNLYAPLCGRPFYHAVYDCYSLIRAFYMQHKGIELKEYARMDDWWLYGENMYDDLFKDAGFEEADTLNGLQQGDIIFMKINSQVCNHAAVYVEGDDILHHLTGRLSRIDNLSTWARMVEKVVRYNP